MGRGWHVPAMIYGAWLRAHRFNILFTGLDWYSTILSIAQISDESRKLFNLYDDPGERYNLAQESGYVDIVDMMDRLMDVHIQYFVDAPSEMM